MSVLRYVQRTGEPLVVVLDPADARNNGMPPYDPALKHGIFIGYSPATQIWTMTHASGARTAPSYLYTYIDSTQSIAALDASAVVGGW